MAMDNTHSPLSLPPSHLGLYVHIPFCVRKCLYCDFVSRPAGAEPMLPDRYLDALAREARGRAKSCDRPLHSIFIGGGTPTVLGEAQLRRLWDDVIAPFPRVTDCEITIEANPGTLTEEKTALLAELPINRVSLGVQSIHADELAMLGRCHTLHDVDVSIDVLRRAGIPSLNLDLMYALPGQSARRWAETLEYAIARTPEHISCYSLILEEGTPLTEQVASGKIPAPDEDEEAAMTALTGEMLTRAGYEQYEVSNCALPGRHCRHNLGYWLGRDYLGIGAAAVTMRGGLRVRNTGDIGLYIERLLAGNSAADYVERLSSTARIMEMVMLGLRLREGFNIRWAEKHCGCSLIDRIGVTIALLGKEGLLRFEGEAIRLTPTGFALANQVTARLMRAMEAARC